MYHGCCVTRKRMKALSYGCGDDHGNENMRQVGWRWRIPNFKEASIRRNDGHPIDPTEESESRSWLAAGELYRTVNPMKFSLSLYRSKRSTRTGHRAINHPCPPSPFFRPAGGSNPSRWNLSTSYNSSSRTRSNSSIAVVMSLVEGEREGITHAQYLLTITHLPILSVARCCGCYENISWRFGEAVQRLNNRVSQL